METIRQLVPLLVQGSLALMLMAFGMECRWEQVRAFRREPGVLARAVLAVNLIVPTVAVAMVLVLPVERPVAVGLLLMAASPLAPLVPGRALKAGGDRPAVMRTYVFLILLAIVLVPVTVLVIGRIFDREVIVPVGAIARLVLIFTVLPIALGVIVAAIAPTLAARAASVLTLIANIVLVLFVVAVLWIAGGKMWELIGNGTILAFTLVSGAAIAAGHMLGGPSWGGRGALAMAAAIRHPGMAVMLARANDADQGVVVAVMLFLLNGVVLTTIYQAWLQRRAPAEAAPES